VKGKRAHNKTRKGAKKSRTIILKGNESDVTKTYHSEKANSSKKKNRRRRGSKRSEKLRKPPERKGKRKEKTKKSRRNGFQHRRPLFITENQL